MPSSLQLILIALGAGLLVGSIVAWWFTDNYKDNRFEVERLEHKVQIETIRAQAATELLESERLRHSIEGTLQNEKIDLIKDHAQRVDSLSNTVSDLSKLVLRDPGKSNSGQGAASSGNSAGAGASGSAGDGVLSKEATEFLWSFATDSDKYVEALRTCYLWQDKVDAAVLEYKEGLGKDQAE